MSITDPTTRTADEWRALASGEHRAAAESFDRCDTDGFLSQWAASQMAHRYNELAQLAEDGGLTDFTGVASVDNPTTPLDARYVETRYGWSWAIETDNGTVWFNESNARKGTTRKANDAKKGYVLIGIRRPAVMTDRGHLIPKRDGEIVSVAPLAYADR